MNRDHSVIFEIASKYCISDSLVDYDGYPSITSHIHNYVLFLFWLHPFILSGVISSLISSSILGTYRPGEFIFQCPIFLPVHTVHMYGCESWTIKKAECRRMDAFELRCWRRVLRAPWTARISNQSILKEISPEYSLEGVMLRLKLQYFGHLMQRADSFEKTLMLGKIERQEEKGPTEDEIVGWHHQLNGPECEQALGDCGGQGILACCSPCGCRVRHD